VCSVTARTFETRARWEFCSVHLLQPAARLDGNKLVIGDPGLAQHSGMLLVSDILMCAHMGGAPNRLVDRQVRRRCQSRMQPQQQCSCGSLERIVTSGSRPGHGMLSVHSLPSAPRGGGNERLVEIPQLAGFAPSLPAIHVKGGIVHPHLPLGRWGRFNQQCSQLNSSSSH
jgi:hypothetical protein